MVVEETTVEDQPTKEIIEIIEEDIVPNRVIEEIIIEDRTVPEIIAQEIIIKDGTITHIGAGPYNGFIQVRWISAKIKAFLGLSLSGPYGSCQGTFMGILFATGLLLGLGF